MDDGNQARKRRVATGDTDAGGPARLVVVQGDRAGRQQVLDNARTVIGRALDCNMRFDMAQLSRHHAVVHRHEDGRYEVEDLGSSNGTFVNGAPVEGPSEISIGDKVQLGTRLVLQLALHDAVHEELTHRQRLEMLGRLGAGIAHDFNNMLGAVLSNVEFLSGLDKDTTLAAQDVHETLTDIRVAASRAADLSQRLVAFAGGHSSGDSIVNVSHVCNEVARLVRRTFPRTISIKTNVGPRLRIGGTSLEMHQVLMNLCLNARDAMGDGGTLQVTAERVHDGERRSIVVRVEDDGEGMDHETQRRIFEPFFTTKREKGFGVGLATVREIVTYLGGGIEVSSRLGEGTRFEITFPEASRTAHRMATSSVRPRDENLPGLVIFVIDDEEMVRRSTRRILMRAGNEVLEAPDGARGVALYRELKRYPDLVLLDVDMPDQSGDDTLREILAINPEAKVVMITGHHDDERELALHRIGANAVIRKPWGPGELLDCVSQAMATSSDVPGESGRPTRT
jgi:signal transduction histidine kinase/ActR/RegA family two-component response regulator